jgi:putative transposase
MVDEIDTNTASENTLKEQPAAAPEPKKQRAKRRTPAELAAVAAAKSQKANGKKAAAHAEVSKPTIASPAKAAAAARAAPSQTPSAAVDEFADLLQLEEENKGLRKALSEKLRAENDELRKRLGQA